MPLRDFFQRITKDIYKKVTQSIMVYVIEQ